MYVYQLILKIMDKDNKQNIQDAFLILILIQVWFQDIEVYITVAG